MKISIYPATLPVGRGLQRRPIARKLFVILFFLVFLPSISFTSYVFSYSNSEIVSFFQTTFSSKQLPGYKKLLYSNDCGNDGKYFEMESALYLNALAHRVKGFGLDIQFPQGKIECCVDGKNVIELRSTEFDVITAHCVYECKSSKNPDKYPKIKQFIKERNMLRWLKKVKGDLFLNRLSVGYRWSRKKHFILQINGPSTLYKDVYMMSSWVTGKTVQECFDRWGKIFIMLVGKQLNIHFKNAILKDGNLSKFLNKPGFRYQYQDNVRFTEEMLLSVTFSQLSLD